MSDQEYVEEIRLVRRKKDTYRSNSSKSDAFESDLLRNKGTRNVAGPTESRPIDEAELRRRYQGDPAYGPQREPSPAQQALADAIIELSTVLIREFVVPVVREVALPAAKAKLSEFAERRRFNALVRAEIRARALAANVVEVEVVEETEPGSTAADVEVAAPGIAVTRSDLLLAQLQLKLAEDFVAQQRWLLAHAEVTDEDLSPELKQSVSLMLEGRADQLDDGQREAVAVFLQEAREAAAAKRTLPPQPQIIE
ncbi:hypothetical protein [Agromyces mariniharenae]|uniref:Uncharacterized protein n=1 Tax=Agromyces mariniharenae TaxID=2604423 RepID=A0A5S4UYJ1_9MICO|nr:hypothetical protein [Agromyces mariniharenae]TYL51178.1 hypothetical protein FYC51_18855 [Agromyces mariniharenae]